MFSKVSAKLRLHHQLFWFAWVPPFFLNPDFLQVLKDLLPEEDTDLCSYSALFTPHEVATLLDTSAFHSPVSVELSKALFIFPRLLLLLVVTMEALHGTGPGYLSNQLFPNGIDLPHPPWQRRHTTGPISQGTLAGGVLEKGFSAVAPALWDLLLPEVRSVPTFLTFCKDFKTWFCQVVWSPDGKTYRQL